MADLTGEDRYLKAEFDRVIRAVESGFQRLSQEEEGRRWSESMRRTKRWTQFMLGLWIVIFLLAVGFKVGASVGPP